VLILKGDSERVSARIPPRGFVCFAEGSSVEEHLSGPATASKRGVKVRNGITGEPWGNVEGKGVSWVVGYFMVNYTIWLSVVKRFFGSVLGNCTELRTVAIPT
jgi:hypothetical protein